MNKTYETDTNIKRVDFDKLLPDFRRFAITKARAAAAAKEGKAGYSRLTSVHSNGTFLYSTDAHRAIRFSADHISGLPSAEPFNYGLRDGGTLSEADYPRMARLFPVEYNEEFEMPYKRLKELRDALARVHKDVYGRRVRNNSVKIEIEGGNLSIKAMGEGVNDFGHSEVIEGITDDARASASFWVNSKYLSDALLTVSKYRTLSGSNFFHLKYMSGLRPFVITDGAAYELLITPVRVC